MYYIVHGGHAPCPVMLNESTPFDVLGDYDNIVKNPKVALLNRPIKVVSRHTQALIIFMV